MRELRLKNNLTQIQVESKASFSEKTIGRIERGETPPTFKTIEKLALGHGMKVNDYINAIAELIQTLRKARK